MERIKSLIKEILSTPPKKDSCNCGCHSCENVGNKGPVINENLNARIVMSKDMKYHVDNKLPLTESQLPYGSDAFLNLWAEARYLYSREAIHVNEADKKILVETNLGEYGMYKGKKVPLDLQLFENEMGSKRDISITSKNSAVPFNNLLYTIKKDHGEDSPIFKDAALAVIDKDAEELRKVLRDYGVYYKYEHLLGLNESYKYVINKGKIKRILNEDSAEKLYKVEGLLVTNNDLLFQKEVLSDIRSVTGVTTVDAHEYTPRLPKENYSYNKLSVKVDPYPYLKNGKFDLETIKQVIQNINNIKGVVKFRVDNPQMINVGV
jgi:hypothetical protein